MYCGLLNLCAYVSFTQKKLQINKIDVVGVLMSVICNYVEPHDSVGENCKFAYRDEMNLVKVTKMCIHDLILATFKSCRYIFVTNYRSIRCWLYSKIDSAIWKHPYLNAYNFLDIRQVMHFSVCPNAQVSSTDYCPWTGWKSLNLSNASVRSRH